MNFQNKIKFNLIGFFLIILLPLAALAQKPNVTDFNPKSGPIGTIVTITGSNFNSTLANNRVFFGAVGGNIIAATATSLTVAVPVGATYQPISVLNTASSLYGYSSKPFGVIYPNGLIADNGSFDASVSYSTGTQPFLLAVGDLDGDGKADIAVANNGSNTVSVFRNTSNSGSITSTSFATKVDFATNGNPSSVAIGDLDGDGKADIAVVNGTSNNVSVLRNTSITGSITSSSFATKVDYATGTNPYSLTIGDLDGDGKSDLVIAYTLALSSSISVLRNTSISGSITTSSFASIVDFPTGTGPRSVSIGDLDGDGKADLAVANTLSDNVSILRNTSSPGSISSGSFGPKVDFVTGIRPYSVAIGDLDGDGKADLAVGNSGSTSVSVLRNTSSIGSITSSSLAPKVDFSNGSTIRSVAIGDLDGDGKADLAVSNTVVNNISIFRNTSSTGSITSSSFATKIDFATGGAQGSITIADLDGDGKADLSVPISTLNNISVLRNNPKPVITSFSPEGGPAGTIVTITGGNFIGTTAVKFGSVNATSFYGITNTSVTAIVPTSVYTGAISITAAGTGTSTNLFYGPPSITSFSPIIGQTGTSITVNGANFIGATQVRFSNGLTATPTLTGSNSLTFVVPVGAANGTLQVVGPGGIATSIESISLAPYIYGITPNSGASGQSITITGLNFTGASAVRFNNMDAADFLVTSNTSATAVVPTGVTTGVISIITPSGSAISTSFFYAPPGISNFSPITGTIGSTISISGPNLAGATQVRFNGIAASFTQANNSQVISAVVPAGATFGLIQVTTPGGSVNSLTEFTPLIPPTITSFTPLTGSAGTVITVTGTNLKGTTSVSIGGINYPVFSVPTNTQLLMTVPTNGVTGILSLTTGGGTATNNQLFSFIQPPTISNLSLTSGPVGTIVAVTGTRFTSTAAATSVRFANKNCVFTIVSPTQINVTIPAGGYTSPISITTTAGTATSGQSFTPTGLVTVVVDSVYSVPGQSTLVPIRVRGFVNLIGLQFSLKLDSGFNLGFMQQLNATLPVGGANITVSNSGRQVNFAWHQGSNTPTTLPDNSILFSLSFILPACTPPGSSIGIDVLTSPLPAFSLPLEAVKSNFTIMPSTTVPGGKVKVQLASLSGKVRTGNGSLVSGVSVYWQTAHCSIPTLTTSTGGAFSFPSLLANANYVLGADKRNDVNLMNGVTVADIALVQRHLLNVSLLGNAYKVLAADVDNSGSVNVLDVTYIRDRILNLRVRFPQGRMWTMVRSDQTFLNQNSPWPFDSLRTYATLPATNINQDFIACKLGDVNDSWNPSIARVNTQWDTVYAQLGNGQANQIGEEVEIPVHVSGNSLSGIQFTLSWPKDKLELVSNAGVFSGCMMGTPTDSTLTLLAMDPLGGIIGNGTQLANLKFKVRGPLNQVSKVKITSDVTPALAYNPSFENMTILGEGGQISLGSVTSESELTSKTQFELWPNPADGVVWIRSGSQANLILTDLQGRKILERKLEVGLQQIQTSGLPAGVYSIYTQGKYTRLVIR